MAGGFTWVRWDSRLFTSSSWLSLPMDVRGVFSHLILLAIRDSNAIGLVKEKKAEDIALLLRCPPDVVRQALETLAALDKVKLTSKGWKVTNIASFLPPDRIRPHQRTATSSTVRSGAERQAAYRLRSAVLVADKYQCVYCGASDERRWFVTDHVDPCGPSTMENLVTACRSCNRTKGDQSPTQAGMRFLGPVTRIGMRYVECAARHGPPTTKTTITNETKTYEDDEVLAVLQSSNGWVPNDETDLDFLAEWKVDFPDYDILEQSKSFRAWHSSRPPMKNYRNAFNNWLKKAREIDAERRAERGDAPSGTVEEQMADIERRMAVPA